METGIITGEGGTKDTDATIGRDGITIIRLPVTMPLLPRRYTLHRRLPRASVLSFLCTSRQGARHKDRPPGADAHGAKKGEGKDSFPSPFCRGPIPSRLGAYKAKAKEKAMKTSKLTEERIAFALHGLSWYIKKVLPKRVSVDS